MDVAIALIIGLVLGTAGMWLVQFLRRKSAAEIARALVAEAQTTHTQDLQQLLDQVRGAFAELSQAALQASNQQFLQLAETRLGSQQKQGEAALEERRKLIDESVKQITLRLTELGNTLQTLERDRRQSHGALLEQVQQARQATQGLQLTTGQLREALASPQRRGQWGERIAEDILRLAGFIEGASYMKQATTAAGNRPDFVFPLPHGRRVNMDVKFPLVNYLKFLEAQEDAAREQCRQSFLRDVRARLRELDSREYIDPDNGTLDFVLVFIPNEQVYSFIHECDRALLDDALRQKVVLCSPLTLYATLAVIRQSAEHYQLERTSREILELLANFNREWQRFSEVMDRMGRALEQAMRQFDELSTTRTRKLEGQLERIEQFRANKQLALPLEEQAAP